MNSNTRMDTHAVHLHAKHNLKLIIQMMLTGINEPCSGKQGEVQAIFLSLIKLILHN